MLLTQSQFTTLYQDTLDNWDEYIYDDDEGMGHEWPKWFHGLLHLMSVPVNDYSIELDQALDDQYSSITCNMDYIHEYRWYQVLYYEGYQLPNPFDCIIKEL